MSTVAKIFVVLNFALAVAFLGAAATFLGYHDSFKKKFEGEVTQHAKEVAEQKAIVVDRETKLDAANRARGDAEKALEAANRESAARGAALTQVSDAYSVLNTAHLKTTSALDVAQKTIQSSRDLAATYFNDRNAAMEKLNTANQEKDNAVRAQFTLQQNLENVTAELKDNQAKLSAKETDLERAEFRIKELERRFGTEGVGAGQPAQTAKVLAADNAANVMVISLGSEDGVKVGYKYTISRGSQYVGTLIITDVSSKQSAGRSSKDLQKSPIQIGDDATSR